MTHQDYLAWERRMSFDAHGGRRRAAAALGKTEALIGRYRKGVHPDGSPVVYSRELDLACAALAMGLEPWSTYREPQRPDH